MAIVNNKKTRRNIYNLLNKIGNVKDAPLTNNQENIPTHSFWGRSSSITNSLWQQLHLASATYQACVLRHLSRYQQ